MAATTSAADSAPRRYDVCASPTVWLSLWESELPTMGR